jgi:methylmalonyl-CoA decarboxylase
LEDFRDKGIRVVILRAPSGTKTWSAGHNVGELPKHKHARDPLTYNDPLRVVVRKIQEYPAPVLAMIEGGVWGGACELAMACDMVIVAENATFGMTPAKLGVPYNLGGIQNMLGSVPLVFVKEMLFRAAPISARRAYEVGIAKLCPASRATGSQDIRVSEGHAGELGVGHYLAERRDSRFGQLSATHHRDLRGDPGVRRRIYDSDDYKERIGSFFEKRKPVFQGK